MSDAIPPPKDELKAAFKAFKKRLKLTRLDAESELTRRPTTGTSIRKRIPVTPAGSRARPSPHPVHTPEATCSDI